MMKAKSLRHKRSNKEGRLQAAKNWLPNYEGKNIVQGYKKHFAVSLLCAVNELEMLGYNIPQEYINQLKIDEVNRAKKNERKKQKKTEQKVHEMYSDSNDEFYYIVGYTSGGAPYGITWTEMGLEPYGEA